MTIESIATREVVMISESVALNKAAELMKDHNIGAIIVIKDKNTSKTPCGIITDRDIMIKWLEKGIDNQALTVGQVMSQDLLTIKQNQSILDAISALSEKGVRRAPVINQAGEVIGIISIDDIFVLLAKEMDAISKIAQKQSC